MKFSKRGNFLFLEKDIIHLSPPFFLFFTLFFLAHKDNFTPDNYKRRDYENR